MSDPEAAEEDPTLPRSAPHGDGEGETPHADADEETLHGDAGGEEIERIRAVLNDVGPRTERLESDVEALADELDAVRADVDQLSASHADRSSDVDDRIEDLRDRLVDLFRDLQAKADDDHSHPELAEAVADLEDDNTELDARIEESRDRVNELEEAVENARTQHEEASEKLSKVASAVVRAQRRLDPLERHVAEQRRLAELTAKANRNGVRKANCEACGDVVLLSLLSTPECPHCNRRIRDLEPNTGFFGRSTLLVGDPPAIEGDVSTRDPADLSEPNEGPMSGDER